jgi:tetratricopeptide (TPR) repeat protein
LQLNHNHANEALKLYQESERIDDTWLSHYELARAYIEAGAFTEANTELEGCVKRKGETTDIYVDEQQTFRYFPPTYYYLGRALEGLKSPGAQDAYKNFLALKVADSQDPLVADARQRVH